MSSIGRRMPRIRHVAVLETSSTLDLCKKLLDDPGQDPDEVLSVTAERQTQGRGTSGRAWESPSGNVLLTVAVPKHHIPEEVLPVYPLLAGCAIHGTVATALRDVVPPVKVQAKWPNDVLIAGAKVSGCMIEDAGAALMVGIGINVAVAPETTDGGRRTASIHQAGGHSMTAEACAKLCTERLLHATVSAASRSTVVDSYRQIMSTDCVMYTRLPDGRRGKKVKPLRLGDWGELTVVDDSGDTETLVADYLI